MDKLVLLTALLCVVCYFRIAWGVHFGTREFPRIGVKKYFLFYWSEDKYKKILLFERKIDKH